MKLVDRARATTLTTGTSDVALIDVVGPYQSLTEFAVGEHFEYCISSQIGNEFEVGVGRRTSSNKLERVSVTSSSNGGEKVSFSLGVKDVVATISAARLSEMAVAPTVGPQGEQGPVGPQGIPGPAGETPDLAEFVAQNGVDVAAQAPTTPTDEHRLLLLDPSTGLPCNALVSALRTLFGSTAPPADTTIPAFGSGAALSSSSVTQTGFTLSWPAATDNVAVTRYEYSLDAGSTWTNAGNVLTVNITGRTAATTYQPRVRAADAAGNVSAALSLSVTTAAATDTTAPSMSGSLTTSNVTQTGYTMNWDAGADNVGVVGYDTSTDGGATWSDAGNVTSRVITGATAATTYNLRVRARDEAGLTSNVLSASVTTSAASGGSDTTKPTVFSVSVADATPAKVVFAMSEALDPAYVPAATTVTVSGHTVSSLAIVGGNLEVTLATTSPFAYGEAARTAAYTPSGTNDLRDLAGNTLDAFTGRAITNNVAQPNFFFDGAASFTTTRNYGASAYVGISSTTYLKVGSPTGTNAGWQTVKDQYDIWGTSIPASQLATWQATPPTSTDSYHDANANTWGQCTNNGTNRMLGLASTFAYKADHGNPPTEAYAYFKAVPKGAGKDAPAVWHGLYDGLNTGTPVKMTFEA